MLDPTAAAILRAVNALHDDVRRLDAAVRSLNSRVAGRPDANLPAFLRAVHRYGGSFVWSTGELLDEARSAGRRDILDVVDRITAACDDERKSLGRYCQQREGVECDGLMLARRGRLWCVVSVE